MEMDSLIIELQKEKGKDLLKYWLKIKITKLIIFLFGFFYSCGFPLSLCDCLTTGGDLPSGCEQVFKDNYVTTDPSMNQMKHDYNNVNNNI
jgi:hypothetical protein